MGGEIPSDYAPENDAETQAAKDFEAEEPFESSYNDAKAEIDLGNSDIPDAGKK